MAPIDEKTPAGREKPRLERVWDAPTRLMKWTTAAAVVTAWVYGQNLSFSNISTHIWIGYGVGALLILRLAWALVGAPASRFKAMASAIRRTPSYLGGVLRPEPSFWPGHNPMGSLWLLAFWAALFVQVGSGLMAYSDSAFDGGPLREWAGPAWSATANQIHATCSKVLLGLVILHLSAVFFYAIWKMEDLIGPMVSGWKWVRRGPDGR